MKKRLGGLLAIVLGAVLIGNGLGVSDSSVVGGTSTGQCSSGRLGITPINQCPTGTISVTDTTPAGTGVPTSWKVTITSTNCLDPATNGAVDKTITVPTGGTASTADLADSQLYIFTSFGADANSTKCEYTLTREAVAGFTAKFTPASPVTIAFDENDFAKRTVAVTLLNSRVVAPTTSAAPTTSTAPSSSASASASPTEESESSSAAPASDTQEAAPIAETGPSQPVKASLWIGIGLVLLGLFLCFEGRVRKFAKHRG